MVWALGGSLLLALLLRLPYLSVPLGRDEGGLSFIALHWHGGHGLLYGDHWVDRPPLLLALFKVAVLGGDTGIRALGAVAAVVLVTAITLLARAVAGPREARIAGLLAAFLTGSISLAAVYTPGELLAAVPSTLSVLCLVLAHRSRRIRFVFAAGALAIVAVLVKQSFLDAGAAGVVFVALSAARDPELRVRWPLAYVAGGAVPLGALLVWLAAAQLSLGDFIYAFVGFRLDLLHALAVLHAPLTVRLSKLVGPAWLSGLVPVVAAAVAGLFHLRGDRVLLVTFCAWFAAATFGVLGGGSYFSHYLIELVPVSCVTAAVALTRARPRVRVAAVGAFAAVALASASSWAVSAAPHRVERAVGYYIRDHARPGDTQYVMYAPANVGWYAGLPQPYPYLWSFIVRAKPGARPELWRLLGSTRRPTWLVEYQDDDLWNMDPARTVDRLIARGYRLAAIVCGHPVFIRNDRAPRPRLTVSTCPLAPAG